MSCSPFFISLKPFLAFAVALKGDHIKVGANNNLALVHAGLGGDHNFLLTKSEAVGGHCLEAAGWQVRKLCEMVNRCSEKRTEKSLMMRKLFHAFKGELMAVKSQKRTRKRPKFGWVR